MLNARKPSSRPSGNSRSGSGRPQGGRYSNDDSRSSGRQGGGYGDQGGSRSGGGYRRKINRFYSIFTEGSGAVDHKDTERLSKFLTEKAKIVPRRMTGLTAKQQRILAKAIKRSRQAGLLPFQVD